MFSNFFRNLYLKHWIARDYYKFLKFVSKTYRDLILIVFDDPHLLELAVLHIKGENTCIKVVFSFHGHELKIKNKVLDHLDRVVFLTYNGYQQSRNNYFQFLPEVFVLGSSIDEKLFFIPTQNEKQEIRNRLGIKDNQIAISWLANARPAKGIHILEKIIQHYQGQANRYVFVIIGLQKNIHFKNVVNVGRVNKSEIPDYLKACELNLFTSLCKEGFPLSLSEAIKCGNLAIASDSGAIKEIANLTGRVRIIEHPNILKSWIEEIDSIDQEDLSITEDTVLKISSFADPEVWTEKTLEAITF